MEKLAINILGIGGHAKVVIDAANCSGILIEDLFDDDSKKWGTNFCGKQVKGPINNSIKGLSIIAIGDNKIRYIIHNKVPYAHWKTVIHPSAIISEDVIIGEGTVIMAGVIIQAGTRIKSHCIINTGSCIDHDCIIDDFVHIGPNCSVAGGVKISEGAFIGIGSSIIPYKTIGRWTTIGAGSVVINDIPENCTAFGVPAKLIKHNNE